MPRFNVGHNGKWACFSTISDEFITPFMRRKHYDRWRMKEYGRAGFIPLERSNLMTYEEAMEAIRDRQRWEDEDEAD